MGPLFAISCFFNASWLFAWHYEKISGSVFIMLGLLVTLIAIYVAVRRVPQRSAAERRLVQAAFSIYLSWIGTASIVNIGVALSTANWSRFGLSEAAWTVIMIGAAVALALAVLYRRNDFLYFLVTIWSLIAIALKPFLPGAIAIAAWAGAGLIGAAALQYAIYRSRNLY